MTEVGPLLSVFIPTRRPSRCLLMAVSSVLSVPTDEIELILHDNCPTDDIRDLLEREFRDPRLRYFQTGGSFSMTGNFSAALGKCNGVFVCGIGDDDSVLPNILDQARWMATNNIDCLKQPMVNYIWASESQIHSKQGRVFFEQYDGKITKKDACRNLGRVVESCGEGYVEGLGGIYHTITRRQLIIDHYKKTGCFLGGTSFDVYGAVAFSVGLKSIHYVNLPFSIWGASEGSNAMRNISGDSLEAHFSEYTSKSPNPFLPPLNICEVSVAESVCAALMDLKNDELMRDINWSQLYAKCFVKSPTIFIKFILASEAAQRKFINRDFLTFILLFLFRAAHVSLKKVLSKPLYFIINKIGLNMPSLFGAKISIKADDIDHASQVLIANQPEEVKHLLLPNFD